MANQGITGRSRSDPRLFRSRSCAPSEDSIPDMRSLTEARARFMLGALGEAALLHHGQEQPHIRQIEAQFFSFGSTEVTHRK